MISLMAMGKAAGAIGAISFVAAAIYDFHRGGDMVDNYVSLKREQSEIVRSIHSSEIRILSAIHSKEKACEVLEAQLVSSKYTHDYCK